MLFRSYAAPNPAYGGRIDRMAVPRTLDQLMQCRQDLPQARLYAGATDVALWVQKQFRDVKDLIYLGDVAELRTIEAVNGLLRIGAAVPLEAAWAALATHWPSVAEMAQRFAGPAVRQAGTLGGNIANGSPIGDAAPVLMALDAQVELLGPAGTRSCALDGFYLDYMKSQLQPDEVLKALKVPLHQKATGLQLKAYKVSKRFDSDISAVSAGMAIQVSQGRVAQIRLAFGGMAAVVKRATQTEQALLGQPWTQETVQAALDHLSQDFTPLSDMRATAAYRLQAAQALLQRFWRETSGTAVAAAAVAPVTLSDFKPTEVQGKHSNPSTPIASLHQPWPHESATLHVQGAAPYTDDVPERAGTLHMALVWSPVAHGTLGPMPKEDRKSTRLNSSHRT